MTRAWPGLALTTGQLTLMATSLLLSLALGYAGGLGAVGAVATAMLIFQVTCGVLQRTLAEATLLAESHARRTADLMECRWSVAAAVLGAGAGGAVALLSTLAVAGGRVGLAIAYAAGIPFAVALDIGRSAGVAAGAARSAFAEAAAWLVVQAAVLGLFAAVRSPTGICVSWAVVNAVFFVLSGVLQTHRRPALRGILAWLRARRSIMSASSLDALLVGLAPVLAMQITSFLTTASTLGVIRVLQQMFAPLAFLSITLRRLLIYRRDAGVATTRVTELRDGLTSMALMTAGAVLLGAAIVAGRDLFPAFAFVPVGAVLVAAGAEKVALGLSFGVSLSKFVKGEFEVLLRARYLMVAVTLVAAPLLTVWWEGTGYLVGSTVGMVLYSVAVLTLPERRRPARIPAQPAGWSDVTDLDARNPAR